MEEENSQLIDTGSLDFIVKLLDEAVNSKGHSVKGLSVSELLQPISQMVVNDDNKSKLVDAGLLSSLLKLMQSGDDGEKEEAIKITWSLCFNDTHVKQKLLSEPGYMDALQSLSQSCNVRVRNMAQGALWKVKDGDKVKAKKPQLTTASVESSSAEGQKQEKEQLHIFISYQWDNQDMVIRIKDRLKACGHSVWIDVEEMGGSTLDAMAGAVENAAVVLICASEKYKLSPNCRTEAEYTFQIKKPLVPLMMQRSYRPDGWLGMLMGAKLYINFDGKYEFDEAFDMLMKELEPYLTHVQPVEPGEVEEAIVPTQSVHNESAPASKSLNGSVRLWNKAQVMEWAKTNKLPVLSKALKSLLQKMDGQLLCSFCQLRQQAPEYFHRRLGEELELNMLGVIQLTAAMDTLTLT